jgi:hypothetical protein
VDRSFDPQLKLLLADPDLRQRGLAAYLAVHLWGRESFPLMEQFLQDECQLLRFDAYSALAMEGGEEGKQIVFSYAGLEWHPLLKKLIMENLQE